MATRAIETPAKRRAPIIASTAAKAETLAAKAATTAAKADTAARCENRARRYDPAETRQRVLAAANMLFATKGYGATGTADIAREADVSEGSIFYHFGSKRNLLADIGRMYGESMIEVMWQGEPLEDLEPGIVLRRAFDFMFQHREWEQYTDTGCDTGAKLGKPAGIHGNPEAEPFYLSSRDTVCAWTTRQHEAAFAKHGGPTNLNIPIASALTYAVVGNAIEAVMATTDEAERKAVIDETIRFVRAAYGYDENGKLLTCI
ncbi:MAG TPA: TetR/AcrR family transcriptional regulator [Polymorphobacter sp.]|nr:TetR/AcrR family transcriptional regulator [Polymorphobacter sp.]